MKRLILIILLCFITTLAYADVKAKIVSQDLDSNGNIRVWVQYLVDGVEVESKYPKIDGKSVYCARYKKQNFLGMNSKQIEDYIKNDFKEFGKKILVSAFNKKAPKTIHEITIEYNTQANSNFINSDFPKIIGEEIDIAEDEILLDTDNDGKADKKIRVKTDGTKIEENINGS